MKILFPLAFFMAFIHSSAYAQNPDTTIYTVAESMPLPLIASCQAHLHPQWTEDSLRRCAESQLLAIVAKNIRYPEEARQKNLEGTVVTSFVVEPNGQISDVQILKDIGGGCGPEAARVIQALNDAGLRWIPAKRNGEAVRMRQALPLRFRLQEALPYYINSSGDSIYVEVDSMPNFKGGETGLLDFVNKNLEYPQAFRDSCKAGIIELTLTIHPSGRAEIENQLDYSVLGWDFQWETTRMVNRSSGLWIPAQFGGKPVATSVPLRAMFKSELGHCKEANAAFDQAMLLANEGLQHSDESKPELALEKWNQALALQPNNCELLYYRGTTLLSMDKREEACLDFNKVKSLMGTTWFESLRRLICGG